MCFTDSENERLAVNPQAEEGITKTPSPYIMKTETSVTSNYYKHDRELSSLLTELPVVITMKRRQEIRVWKQF